MPTARVNGVTLYYEETGSGFPLIWCHEFGGDYRSWEPQVRYFSRRYRVNTWNCRGFRRPTCRKTRRHTATRSWLNPQGSLLVPSCNECPLSPLRVCRESDSPR